MQPASKEIGHRTLSHCAALVQSISCFLPLHLFVTVATAACTSVGNSQVCQRCRGEAVSSSVIFISVKTHGEALSAVSGPCLDPAPCFTLTACCSGQTGLTRIQTIQDVYKACLGYKYCRVLLRRVSHVLLTFPIFDFQHACLRKFKNLLFMCPQGRGGKWHDERPASDTGT